MPRLRSLALAAALALAAPAAAAETCDDWHGIWARDTDDGRWIVYFADVPIQTAWNTFLELWQGNERVARIRGNFLCPNGIQFCSLGIEALSPAFWPEAEDPNDPETRDDPDSPVVFYVPFDTINMDGTPYFNTFWLDGDPPDWIVFAQLTQHFHAQQRYLDTAAETMRIGPPGLADRKLLVPPSTFRYFGCRDGAYEAEPFNAPDPFFGP